MRQNKKRIKKHSEEYYLCVSFFISFFSFFFQNVFPWSAFSLQNLIKNTHTHTRTQSCAQIAIIIIIAFARLLSAHKYVLLVECSVIIRKVPCDGIRMVGNDSKLPNVGKKLHVTCALYVRQCSAKRARNDFEIVWVDYLIMSTVLMKQEHEHKRALPSLCGQRPE